MGVNTPKICCIETDRAKPYIVNRTRSKYLRKLIYDILCSSYCPRVHLTLASCN